MSFPRFGFTAARARQWIVPLLLAALLWLARPTVPAVAHGDGQALLLDRVPLGELFLTVWAQPAVLRPGEVHFAAQVTDADRQIVEGCRFRYAVRPLDKTTGREGTPAAAVSAGQDGEESAVVLETAGRYEVVVTVTEPTGSQQQQRFEIEVTSLPLPARLFLQAITLLSVAVGAWLLTEGMRIFNVWRPVSRRPSRPARRGTTEDEP